MSTPKLFVVAGSPGSGKDELVRAVRDLGETHAAIVPKHTSRKRQSDDGDEMVCSDDKGFDLARCQLEYGNYEARYGVKTDAIWRKLRLGVSQVLVVSNVAAIQSLIVEFGDFVRLLYVHSVMTEEDFARQALEKGYDSNYSFSRLENYWDAFEIYVRNIGVFDHVLIHAADNEDLYDQIFRLFRAYERGELRER